MLRIVFRRDPDGYLVNYDITYYGMSLSSRVTAGSEVVPTYAMLPFGSPRELTCVTRVSR